MDMEMNRELTLVMTLDHIQNMATGMDMTHTLTWKGEP
jgi:hypothetical protein